MSGLSDELAPKPRPPKCLMQVYLARLDEVDAETLKLAINDQREPPAETISRVLKARGLVVSSSTIKRHRARDCQSCAEAGLYR